MLPLFSAIIPVISPPRSCAQSRLKTEILCYTPPSRTQSSTLISRSISECSDKEINFTMERDENEELLSFAGRQLKLDSSEAAEQVANTIEAHECMRVLELKGNTIGCEAGRRLAEAIETHPELEQCLWSDIFTGRLKTEIPPILRSMCGALIHARCNITELDLSDNAFGPIGAEGISEFLVSPAAYSLLVLKLNNNGLGAGGKIVAECLSKCYDNAKRDGYRFALKTFIAGRNRLEDPGAIALGQAFQKIGSLEQITIPQNGISSKGIIAMSNALRHNRNLRILNFNDNTCTSEGALAISVALGDLLELEELNLGDSLCRNAGVTAIIAQLSAGRHQHLSLVDLSGNELSANVACSAIDQLLEIYGEDLELRLTNNCFGHRFDEVRSLAATRAPNGNVDLGESDDDEGTGSEAEVDSDDDSVINEELFKPQKQAPVPPAAPAAESKKVPFISPFQQPSALSSKVAPLKPATGQFFGASTTSAVSGTAPGKSIFGSSTISTTAAFNIAKPMFGNVSAPAFGSTTNGLFGSKTPSTNGFSGTQKTTTEPSGSLFGLLQSKNEEPRKTATVSQASERVSFLDEQLKLDTAADAEEVIRVLDNCGRMQVLELRGNTLGVAAGERVAKSLERHPELERCLWSDLFTGRLKSEIPIILKSLCGAMMKARCEIKELNLSDNAFGPIGAEGIKDFLLSPSAFSLETLELNNNGLGAGGVVIGKCLLECSRLSTAAGRPLRLKKFVAGRNRLEIPGATSLAEAFSAIGSLEEITVHQNGIRPEGIQKLAKGFESNPNLRIINVNDNTATEKGSCAVAQALRKLPLIEVVNLGDCLCRDYGCHAIVDALDPAFHKNLKEVDLSGAELTGEAAIKILEKWIKKFPNVRLNLSSNNFGHLFDEICEMCENTEVNVGDEEDDEGTLSVDENEIRSNASSDEETYDEQEDDEEEDDEDVVALESSIKSLDEIRRDLDNAVNEFASTQQEAGARFLIRLSTALHQMPSIKNEVVSIAEEVIKTVEGVRLRPIPSTTQLVNHLVAQARMVKCEESWGLTVCVEALKDILHEMLIRGHLQQERQFIQHFFK